MSNKCAADCRLRTAPRLADLIALSFHRNPRGGSPMRSRVSKTMLLKLIYVNPSVELS
jgi:hypothetical protein